MKYPDDFNTPAFPAGKFVAVSRFMATAIMVVFFLIICACGLLYWVKKTQDVSPFLISIAPNGERWVMVSHDNHKTEIPAYYVLQESMLNKFARNWFTISENMFQNLAVWSDECGRESEECTSNTLSGGDTCAIYCASDTMVFDDFKRTVLPIYSKLESDEGEVWTVESVSIKPVDTIGKFGGLWKLNVLVRTNSRVLNFFGYAQTAYSQSTYPKTMGYYVAGFNMYRMN